MAAPKMPRTEYRNTASRVTSHRVAPRAKAASRCESGTARKTSRAMEVMMGRIIMAMMTAAESMHRPVIGPRKNGRKPKILHQQRIRAVLQPRHQHAHAPKAKDHARNGRQHLDHRDGRLPHPARRQLGQINRRPQAQRQRDEQSDEGGDKGPENKRQRPKVAADRIPVGMGKEISAELRQGKSRSFARGPADQRQEQQDHHRHQPGQQPEDLVAGLARRGQGHPRGRPGLA